MDMEVLENISLAPYTTFKTGGNARYVLEVTTLEELETAVVFAEQKQLPFFVLGGGSNTLVPDEGYGGVVIVLSLKGRTYAQVSQTHIEATFGAGEVFDEVVQETTERGWWGMENLSSIPGTVGATPIQNVGAYGVEIADLITTVIVFDTLTKGIRYMQAAECQFGYRDSIFKHTEGGGLIVTGIICLLSNVPQPQLSYADLASLSEQTDLTPLHVREAVIGIRAQKFPDWNSIGTAGSFFKNPSIPQQLADTLVAKYPLLPVYPTTDGAVKVSLGFILDKICNLKGYTKNNVGLYEKQALVLVAKAGATTNEVSAFADEIAEIIFQKTKIHIEREVTLLK